MMEQENPRIKWDTLMAWRIAQVGIEVDTRRPLRVHLLDTLAEEDATDWAMVTVPTRLRNGRAIDTTDLPIDPIGYHVGQFSGMFQLDGEGISPGDEDMYFMPDFTCDCRSGEITKQYCDHKAEVWRRTLEIVSEAGRTHAGEILDVLKSQVRVWKAVPIDFTGLHGGPRSLGSRYRSNNRF